MMKNLNFVQHVDSRDGIDEYLILAEYPEIDYTLLIRESKYEPFVAAWGYNKDGNYWGQGHYFSDIVDACAYIKEKLDAKEGKMTTERLTEIATGSLHKVIELDGADLAYRFFKGYEMDMSAKELESFGCVRNRVAYDIVWDINEKPTMELPTRVEIPEDVDDDDIDDYIESIVDHEYSVNDYSVEEDEF